ncbi:hypothetical protein HDG38_006863 [Paraburkholderia sp. WSM4177]|nr:hypothetical protein [Paraburkholderia sp. WSM4177]MBB5488609.1 hypothetical protein [Paraburkholderia sp. WSM4180]
MRNTASAPTPKVVQKSVKNTIPRAPAKPVRSATDSSGVRMPTKSCNCGGSGSR